MMPFVTSALALFTGSGSPDDDDDGDDDNDDEDDHDGDSVNNIDIDNNKNKEYSTSISSYNLQNLPTYSTLKLEKEHQIQRKSNNLHSFHSSSTLTKSPISEYYSRENDARAYDDDDANMNNGELF
ncbi:unnamed protein product [Thelazia callipaeda]|uniref:Secreted protein n=1 Tax=Thelazia callipaeda TaxID=103827 RepID=A0A0N5CPB5_THECL|nr:unnamed protein product [Thelazia callipaeda]